MNNLKWQDGLPTEWGHYLFWGYRFKKDDRKCLLLVKVTQSVNHRWIYVANDNFMQESEVGEGKFAKLDLEAIVPNETQS